MADVCEALSADRPYRAGMPLDEVMGRLRQLVAIGHLDGAAVEALSGWFMGLPKAGRPAVVSGRVASAA